MIRSACIIGTGVFGDHRALVKNRDRNYIPQLRIVRDKIGSVEVLYIEDLVTGWREGLNGAGVGIVNTALAVKRDEKADKGTTDHDGDIILKALSKTSLRDAVDAITQGGLTGHTFVGNAEQVIAVELPQGKTPATEYVTGLAVRTNHGIRYPDVGYLSGVGKESSNERFETALRVFPAAKEPRDLPLTLMDAREPRAEDPTSPVKKTDEMRTSSQMVLDLTDPTLYLYLLPGEQEYLGFHDKVQGKIKLHVYEYNDDGTTLYELNPTTGERMSKIPTARKVFHGQGAPRKADLNPPLGSDPDGAAAVVHRIMDRIRNPRMREDMSERALDLTNPEAFKVYPIALENGSAFKSFVIRPHAEFRMDLRSVTVGEIRGGLNEFADALMQWKKDGDPRYEEALNAEKFTWISPRTRLVIVLGVGGGEVQIISTYYKGSRDPSQRDLQRALENVRQASLDPQSQLRALENLRQWLDGIVLSYLGITDTPRIVRASVHNIQSSLELANRAVERANTLRRHFESLGDQESAGRAHAVAKEIWNLRADIGSMLSGIAQKRQPVALTRWAKLALDTLRERGLRATAQPYTTAGTVLFEGAEVEAPLSHVILRAYPPALDGDIDNCTVVEIYASTIGVPEVFAQCGGKVVTVRGTGDILGLFDEH